MASPATISGNTLEQPSLLSLGYTLPTPPIIPICTRILSPCVQDGNYTCVHVSCLSAVIWAI